MAKLHRSAMGNSVDMDILRLNNEHIIAVGNMKVNAKGDQLGAGGTIAKTRNQVMNDYYQLNTPTVGTSSPIEADHSVFEQVAEAAKEASELRGSLAGEIAKTASNKKINKG